MTQKIADFGLLKIPDNVLLKNAITEIGKLNSYINELEDDILKLKITPRERQIAIHRNEGINKLRKELKRLKKENKNLIFYKTAYKKNES